PRLQARIPGDCSDLNGIATLVRALGNAPNGTIFKPMLQDPHQPERPVAMTSGPIAGAGAGQSDGAVTLPRLRAPGLSASLPRPRFRVGRRTCRLAVAVLILGTFAVVAAAAGGPSILVPRSSQLFPNWEAGPLHDVIPRLIEDPQTLGLAFSGV